jgi:hypothetical protein
MTKSKHARRIKPIERSATGMVWVPAQEAAVRRHKS